MDCRRTLELDTHVMITTDLATSLHPRLPNLGNLLPALPRTGLAAIRAVVLGGLMVVCPAAARADLKLCNQTPGRVGVAVGYLDPAQKDGKGWITEGWWNVASKTCETLVKGTLQGRFYYVHAVDYDRGGEWAGSSFMCTADKKFTIKSVPDCPKEGYKRTGFFEVDTGESADWTVRLADPGESGARGR
jgi:uncharacterized membrane protein